MHSKFKKKYFLIISGHDMLSLLFHFLDEFLYIFSVEPFFIACVSITSNPYIFNISAKGFYSNMGKERGGCKRGIFICF